MLSEKEISDVFAVLDLASEQHRQSILCQGVYDHYGQYGLNIPFILTDNTGTLQDELGVPDAKLE